MRKILTVAIAISFGLALAMVAYSKCEMTDVLTMVCTELSLF